MNNDELTTLFRTAALFAEQTYQELFNYQPDTNQRATQELLDALMQAWLTGYAYTRTDPQLNNSIEEVFGFFVKSDNHENNTIIHI